VKYDGLNVGRISIIGANGGDVVEQGLTASAGSAPAAIRELVSLAERGDELAAYELQGLPDCPDIWKGAGDLDRQTRKAWLDLLAGNDLIRREALKRELADMRAKYDGAEPTFLEGCSLSASFRAG
jgi:hypothetical protein